MESSDYVGCFINDAKSGHFGIIRANVAAQNRAAGRYTSRGSQFKRSSSLRQKCTCFAKQPNDRISFNSTLLGACLDVLAENHHLVDFYDLPDFFVGEVLLTGNLLILMEFIILFKTGFLERGIFKNSKCPTCWDTLTRMILQ